MPWLFLITLVLLVATYLFMPTPQQQQQSPNSLDDFDMPDNSNTRLVPKVYGRAYLSGNCVYYGNLNNTPIYS